MSNRIVRLALLDLYVHNLIVLFVFNCMFRVVCFRFTFPELPFPIYILRVVVPYLYISDFYFTVCVSITVSLELYFPTLVFQLVFPDLYFPNGLFRFLFLDLYFRCVFFDLCVPSCIYVRLVLSELYYPHCKLYV